MLIPVLLFIAGFALLIKGGDWFVDGASGIAHRLKVPELLIGATVVSIGTTLPEGMVSATSAVSGHGEIAYGNAIGSVICNAALICALTCAIRPAEVERRTFRTPVIFFFLAAALYCYFAYVRGEFSRAAGLCLLALFLVYMVVTVVEAMRRAKEAPAQTETPEGSVAMFLTWLVFGAAAIAVGARLLVDNGTKIAQALGVPESVIALTFVALGTSLPELATAITALVKGHSALSLGNIIGANLFNLVLVTGVSASLRPFSVPGSKLIAGMNSSLVVDIPVMLLVMALLTLPALARKKLTRGQGIVLLLIYAAFCVYQFAI